MKKFLLLSIFSSVFTISLILGLVYRENMFNFLSNTYRTTYRSVVDFVTPQTNSEKIEEYKKWYESIANDPIARNMLKESDFKVVEDSYSKYFLPLTWNEARGTDIHRITSAEGIFIKHKIINYSKREVSAKGFDGLDVTFNQVLFDPNTFGGFDISEDFLKRLENLSIGESYKSKNQTTEFSLKYVIHRDNYSSYYFQEFNPLDLTEVKEFPRGIYVFKSATNLAVYEIQDNSEDYSEIEKNNKALTEVFIERYELK
jgi:hypothetical protein